MNQREKAADVYMKIIAQAEARTPNYQKTTLGALRYNVGKALMNMDRLDWLSASLPPRSRIPRLQSESVRFRISVWQRFWICVGVDYKPSRITGRS